ncbi:hypothetical protein LY78DRAFT_186728 [Colletotrichum sublineola]|nr:hypothetical protein LY78DRAFT_186728 [Colletotrichum sublineola]
MPASRAPLSTPTTIDTPNKILAKWQPVYPQRTEGLKGWYEQDVRGARAKTWHGDTAQRPSTYRKPRKTLPPVDEVEPPSPRSMDSKRSNRSPEQKKPPVQTRAEARLKTSRQQPEPPTESSASRGLRKQSPLDAFKGQENVAPNSEPFGTVPKKPTTAAAPFFPYEDASPAQPSTYQTCSEAKEPQEPMKKPLRVSINQPERKAREKALLQQGTKAGLEHPPVCQFRRMFRSLQGPPKIPEADYKKRPAMTSQGTISSNADLPSTWKLTLSTSSSLELAMEAASQEMDRRESKLPEGETILKEALAEQPQPTATLEDKDDERTPPPSSKESIPWPKEQPTRKTFRDGHGSVSKGLDDSAIDDRDVLRGLNIAISAACDEEVDAWIRRKTGVRIRRFLADLKAFESLGDENEPDPARERARKKRADSRKLEAQIQQSRAAREARAQ